MSLPHRLISDPPGALTKRLFCLLVASSKAWSDSLFCLTWRVTCLSPPPGLMACRYELLMQYFQIKLNFGTKDQSHMFVLAGLCGMFTQLVILRLLLRYVGKARMLLVGEAGALTATIPIRPATV